MGISLASWDDAADTVTHKTLPHRRNRQQRLVLENAAEAAEHIWYSCRALSQHKAATQHLKCFKVYITAVIRDRQ